VILSTHIVSDVADLCANMAIINQGQVLLEGQTQQLINDVSCKIWQRFVDKKDLPQFQVRHAVISTRLLSGRTLIHVYSDDDPGDGFEEAAGDLEDVYFATIAGRHNVANACD
jgi:ABC-type multidrug transport system ATPase subunit